MAKVDVVIPCYNYGRFLEVSTRSVLEQSMRDLRVLIIDDASSDASVAIANRLAESDARVSVIAHRQNQGHIATYNEGITWAAADYLLILSADDLLMPGALARATAILDANPDVVLAYGKCLSWRDEFPLPKIRAREHLSWARQDLVGDMCAYSGRPHPQIALCTPTAVVRTQLQKELGGYCDLLPHSADMEMWLRLAAHGSVARIDEVQGVYRRHSSNMSNAYFDRELADLRQRKQAFDKFFAEYGSQLPEADKLQECANDNLAEKVFWSGIVQFCRGRTGSARQLLQFSFELRPSLRYRPPLKRAPSVFADIATRLAGRVVRAVRRTKLNVVCGAR